MSEHDIIYIESDEEITSVVDRLHKSQAKDFILVVPRGAMVLASLVNLKLLKREAQAAKKSIGIVSADQIGRKLIARAGIAILDSVENKRVLVPPGEPIADSMPEEIDLTAPKKPDVKVHHFQDRQILNDSLKPSQPDLDNILSDEEFKTSTIGRPLGKAAAQSPQKSKRRKYLAIFIFILILIALAVFGPSAQVNLNVASEPYQQSLDIEISTKHTVPSVEQSIVPGSFAEGQAKKQEKFNTSGLKNVGEKAKGQATITNDAGVDQVLSSGSNLSGGGLSFVTTADVTVPKATLNADGDKIAGTSQVAVEAAQAGDKSNVKNLAVSVPKEKLTGKIVETTGGSTREVRVVSAEDIAAAKATLEKSLKEDIKTQISEKTGKVVMDGGLEFSTLTEQTNPAEGTEAEEFETTLELQAKALTFAEAVFRETFLTILRQGLPAQKELVLTSSDEITTQVTQSDFTSGVMTVKGEIKTQLVPELNLAVIRKDLVNKQPPEAQQILNKIDQVEGASIEIKPAWWLKRLPLFAARIKINLNKE